MFFRDDPLLWERGESNGDGPRERCLSITKDLGLGGKAEL